MDPYDDVEARIAEYLSDGHEDGCGAPPGVFCLPDCDGGFTAESAQKLRELVASRK
jgi:hypothetical protein